MPTERSIPLTRIEDFAWLIYGPPGMGKTTLAGEFEDCFHMMFEPGAKDYALYDRPVTSWEDARGYVALLEKGGHGFKTVCVDGLEIAYTFCLDWMIKNKFTGNHPSDMDDHGKSWNALRCEWQGFILNLLNIPEMGNIFLSHEREVEIETRDGKHKQVRPDLSGAPWSVVEGRMDVIGNLDFDWDSDDPDATCLTVRGPRQMASKCRLDTMLLTSSGKLIQSIPMGSSKEEAHANLMKACSGKQSRPTATLAKPKRVVKKRKRTVKKKK